MPKRTRREFKDINQFAADVVRRSTQEPGPVDLTGQAAISQVMRAIRRRGGLNGAATLNARLSPGAPLNRGAKDHRHGGTAERRHPPAIADHNIWWLAETTGSMPLH
jgi:hypothetical protein